MSESETLSPNEVLQALLGEHGYAATISGEHVVVQGHEAQLSSEVLFRSETAPAQVQLDVRVHLPDGRTVVESFAGIGDSFPYALGDAFDNFSRSSFHVLLNAFFGGAQEVLSEEWVLPGGRFTAWIGDATFRGEPPAEGEDLVGWFETFVDAIKEMPLSPQPHWIRLFYAQHQGQTMVCEGLLDNFPWEEGQHQMERFHWLPSEEFYSTRIFLVLLPV